MDIVLVHSRTAYIKRPRYKPRISVRYIRLIAIVLSIKKYHALKLAKRISHPNLMYSLCIHSRQCSFSVFLLFFSVSFGFPCILLHFLAIFFFLSFKFVLVRFFPSLVVFLNREPFMPLVLTIGLWNCYCKYVELCISACFCSLYKHVCLCESVSVCSGSSKIDPFRPLELPMSMSWCSIQFTSSFFFSGKACVWEQNCLVLKSTLFTFESQNPFKCISEIISLESFCSSAFY